MQDDNVGPTRSDFDVGEASSGYLIGFVVSSDSAMIRHPNKSDGEVALFLVRIATSE